MWLILLALVLVVATRPWRAGDDDTWVEESALVAAALAGAVLISIL